MHTIKTIAFTATLAMFTMTFISCGSSSNESETDVEMTDTQTDKGKEYTSAYICPMHCEGSGSEKPGKCPVCGMDYVANEEVKSEEGHGAHDGHNH